MGSRITADMNAAPGGGDSRERGRNRLRRTDTRRLTILLGVALIARAAYWAFAVGDGPLLSDAAHYHEIATRIANGDGFSHRFPGDDVHATAFRAPVYPGLLGLVYAVFWPAPFFGRVLNSILGLAVVFLAERLGTRYGGPRVGLVAGGGVALWPEFLANDTATLNEPVSMVMILGLVFLLLDRRAAWAGALAGTLVLTRPSAQALVPVVAAWCWFRLGTRAAGAVVVSAILVVSPWVVRNWVQLGRPVVVTSNGFNLVSRYSPEAKADHGEFIDATRDVRLHRFHVLAESEAVWDHELCSYALEFLRQEPLWVLRVVRNNLQTLFEIDPLRNEWAERNDNRNLVLRAVSLPFFYPLAVGGVVGLWRHRRTPGVGVVALVVAPFLFGSLLLVSPPRLRAPFDAAAFLGLGLSLFGPERLTFEWIRSRARRRPRSGAEGS